MLQYQSKVILTVALAVVAALVVSVAVFLSTLSPHNLPSSYSQQGTTPVSEEQTLQSMTPTPPSATAIAKESATLQAVSKNSGSSASDQQKLNVLSSMGGTQ